MNAIPFPASPANDAEAADLLRADEKLSQAMHLIGDDMAAIYAPRRALTDEQRRDVTNMRLALALLDEARAVIASKIRWRQ